jgi:signal transduction histidine kinase
MKRAFMILLSAGLFVLLIVLFGLSCSLNRRQHLANVQSIRADYLEILNREISDMRQRNQEHETQVFSLFNQPDLPFDLYLVNRLFTVKEGRFFPAGLPDVPPAGTLDPETARKAFLLGLEMQKAGRSDKAREYLETAARIPAKTPDELDIRIMSHIELLRIAEFRDLRTLFGALYSIFDYPDVKPSGTQLEKYEEVLRSNVQRYDKLKEQSREAWRTALELSGMATNRSAPFRMLYKDQVLSVNVNGYAFLSPVQALNNIASNMMMRVSAEAPGANAVVSRQLHSLPVHAWIPARDFELRKQSAERAYLVTNIMLAVLLAVITGMGIGIGIILRRQHEVTVLKNSFVSAVSHELRTPTALIRLYAESLASEHSRPDKREHYTRAIMAETDRLSVLVNNVLDFARMEKGSLVMNTCEVDVSELCNEVLDSFSFRLEKENVRLARKIESGLKAVVDPLALTQVIFNLVDNAIKYSGSGHGIEVEMTAAGAEILLRVKDNGIGIPASLKPRIFEPFVRGEDNRVTSQRGSGIGLSVVKQLLERMHCSVRFSDNTPAGTVFEITLPRAGVQPAGTGTHA